VAQHGLLQVVKEVTMLSSLATLALAARQVQVVVPAETNYSLKGQAAVADRAVTGEMPPLRKFLSGLLIS
jgi:hypothetical protein